MQLEFTPEQEARLSQIAHCSGVDPEQLVKDAALRLLHEDGVFRADVAEGIASADRGEFVDGAEVWANVEAILKS
ncbi:MAG TPA: hypothetical protein VGN16_15420 [Acidobacteriaceae bacterium]|jgi:predicted transcriptional regulator